jgi:hypothetical protein
MADAPTSEYRPLWLTAEEHDQLFGELLKTPEGFMEERLLDLLTKADARAKDFKVQLSTGPGGTVIHGESTGALQPSALVAARRLFFVMAVGVSLIVFIGVLASILVRR